MINSTINKYKRIKIDTEGELQSSASTTRNLSGYLGIKKQLNIIESTINSQTINIECNSATFTTDVTILDSVKILFPVPNEVFTGRYDEFDKLSDYLMKNHLAIVCGMTGIGKTECSKKFAWNNSAKYGIKLWINTDSSENIQKSINEIARKLSITIEDRDIPNIINDIYNYFENRQIYTLIVFDNANDKQSINHILPSKVYHDNSFIHIIITSQNKKWGKQNGKVIPTIELFPLIMEFGVKVFREIIKDDFGNYDLLLWEKLCKFLNGIPLALQITAAYIKNEIESIEEFGTDDETFSLSEYIDKLEKELHLIIDEPFPEDSENDYPRTIYVAVKLTLNKIKLNSAFDMLYAISYLSPNHISFDQLINIMTQDAIRKSLEVLSKFSLINTNSYKLNKRIGIHRLVQWTLRYHQQNCGREIQNIHFNKIFTIVLNNKDFIHYKSLLKHEMIFKEIIRDYFVLNSEFEKVYILVDCESVNSLSLVCESLEPNNTKMPIEWIRLALDFGKAKSFKTLHHYLENINNQFKYLDTINDGILILAVMNLEANAQKEFEDTFRVLLEKCSNVNVRDGNGYGYTPIMLAVHRGLAKIVSCFISTKKVDYNYADQMGWTVFHYLIGSFHLYAYKELSPSHLGTLFVNYGFKTNVIDRYGRSLLHHACKYVSPLYLEYLIEHKLDVNLKDYHGNAPLFICFEHQPMQFESSKFLLKNEDCLIACIDVLTKNNADVNILNNNGQTILHLAAKYYPLVVEYLINTHKMDVNLKDNAGVTPSDEIRARDPCYDDVETSKTMSRIVYPPKDQDSMFYSIFDTLIYVILCPLTWTMNIDKKKFTNFSCFYNKDNYDLQLPTGVKISMTRRKYADISPSFK